MVQWRMTNAITEGQVLQRLVELQLNEGSREPPPYGEQHLLLDSSSLLVVLVLARVFVIVIFAFSSVMVYWSRRTTDRLNSRKGKPRLPPPNEHNLPNLLRKINTYE